jgi:hypothetical protein
MPPTDPAAALLASISGIPAVGPYLGYIPLFVALSAFIDALIPQPAAGSRWVTIRKVVSVIGGSFGAARNATQPGQPAAATKPATP